MEGKRAVLVAMFLWLVGTLSAKDTIDYARLKVDCQQVDCAAFLSKHFRPEQTNSVELIHFQGKNLPSILFRKGESSLSRIILTEALSIKAEKVMQRLKGTTITSITFQSCGLASIPKSVSDIAHLEEFHIKENGAAIDPLGWEYLIQQGKMKKITLSGCHLQTIPMAIKSLIGLASLDVSENELEEIPKEIKLLRKLKSLYLQDNLITDYDALVGIIKRSKVTRLVIDGAVSKEERTRIRNQLEGRNIRFDIEEALPEHLAAEQGVDLEIDGSVILSDAYVYYGDAVQRGDLMYSFDTLSFSGRYKNRSYNRNEKLTEENKCQFFIKSSQKIDQQQAYTLSFDVNRNLLFPELSAYSGVIWLVDEEGISFEENYIRANRCKCVRGQWFRPKRRYFTDLRVYYDDQKQTHTWELKDENGFYRMQMKAVYPGKDPTVFKVSDENFKRHLRYQRTLQKLESRMNRKQQSKRRKYDRVWKKKEELVWQELHTKYMSKKEQAMSKEQWLRYYEVVVAHENKELVGARVSESIWSRYLQLNGYRENTQEFEEKVLVNFENPTDGGALSPSRLYLVDHFSQRYWVINGNAGMSADILPASDWKNCSLVAFTPAGNSIVAASSALTAAFIDGQKKGLVKSLYFEKGDLTTEELLRRINIQSLSSN